MSGRNIEEAMGARGYASGRRGYWRRRAATSCARGATLQGRKRTARQEDRFFFLETHKQIGNGSWASIAAHQRSILSGRMLAS
jgi:hypothetical protein